MAQRLGSATHFIRSGLRVAVWCLLGAVAAVALAEQRGVRVVVRETEDPHSGIVGEVELYRSSHALVIGIDKYQRGWPRLSNAVADARLIAAALRNHGFADVTVQEDLDSTALDKVLRSFFLSKGQDSESRLFVWFAGHGYTEGREGYLVPVDAPSPSQRAAFFHVALPIRRFHEYMHLTKSKHVLTVFDACFAGTIFDTMRGLPPPAITLATTRPVRMFITSGDANQEVSDDGTFRRLFLSALSGDEVTADRGHDGYVTGTELGLFLTDRMTNLTKERQTPRYGKLRSEDFDRGDFVFVVGDPRSRLPAAEAAIPGDAAANRALEEDFQTGVQWATDQSAGAARRVAGLERLGRLWRSTVQFDESLVKILAAVLASDPDSNVRDAAVMAIGEAIAQDTPMEAKRARTRLLYGSNEGWHVGTVVQLNWNLGSGNTPDDEKRLQATREAIRKNWEHLEHAHLIGTNLRGAQLYEANLANASLAKADLECATLRGATIRGASFTDARVRHLNIKGIVGEPSEPTDFTKWALSQHAVEMEDWAYNAWTSAGCRDPVDWPAWAKAAYPVDAKSGLPLEGRQTSSPGSVTIPYLPSQTDLPIARIGGARVDASNKPVGHTYVSVLISQSTRYRGTIGESRVAALLSQLRAIPGVDVFFSPDGYAVSKGSMLVSFWALRGGPGVYYFDPKDEDKATRILNVLPTDLGIKRTEQISIPNGDEKRTDFMTASGLDIEVIL